jgi:hypothetical protein
MLETDDRNNSIMIKKSKQSALSELINLLYSCITKKNECLQTNFNFKEQREAFSALYFKLSDALSLQIGRKLEIFSGACFAHLGVLCLPYITESKQRQSEANLKKILVQQCVYSNTSLWIYWRGPDGESVRECAVNSIEEIHKI